MACSNWRAEDEPLSYEFYYRTSQSRPTLLHFGPQSSSMVKLGDPKHNYMLQLQMRVLDFYGAAAYYSLRVQVRSSLVRW